MMWPPRGVRLIVEAILLLLPASDREAALSDLDVLSDRVRRSRGVTVAIVWLLWHALEYPVYQRLSTPRWERSRSRTDGARVASALDRWTRELRFAFRRIRRRPLPSAVIVLTLAIGVGAGTSVFSVLHTLLLRPLPFAEPNSLVRVRESFQVSPGAAPQEVTMSARRFEALRDRSTSFEGVAAARYRTFTLSGDGEPERAIGLLATWNHFSVLGVEPVLGRVYGPDEDAAGAAAPVAVISHSLWTRRFGADPAALGAGLEINGLAHTVIGVMPRGFRYPYAGEIWLPMGIDPSSENYENRGLNITARLAPTSSIEALSNELSELSATFATERPDTDATMTFVFRPIDEEILEGVPEKVLALLWAAGFVLLIAAANIASMILARLHSEVRELHLQVALGATGSDLTRRVLSEGMVLAMFGLAVGLIISSSSIGWLTALSPVSDLGPYFQDFTVGRSVTVFAAFLALAAVGLASLPTLLRLRTNRFTGNFRVGSIGATSSRSRISFLDSLVVGEMALAVLLLTGAGLTVQTLRSQWNSEMGIEASELYTFGISPAASGYPDRAERVAFVSDVLARVQAISSVSAAAATTMNPMRSQGWGAAVWPEGRVASGATNYFTLNHRGVTPDYFEAAGTGLLQGRFFQESDGPDDPGVVILSRGAADLLWPGAEALGRSVRVGAAGGGGPLLTVVGVVEDVHEGEFLTDTWYRPYRQDPRDFNTEVVEIFVRSSSEPGLLIPAVRQAIRAVDPGVPVFRVQTMDDILRVERRVEAFATVLLGLFAVIGIVLASVGIYGVLSYATAQRTRELGLRVALGAGRFDVLLDVTARTLRSCGLGLILGLAGAFLSARFLEAFVPGVPSFSPGVFGLAAGGALLAGLVAALGPALRALRIHPRTALAGE